MSKPEPDTLRNAATAQGGPVLDYTRRNGERVTLSVWDYIAATAEAVTTFVSTFVGVACATMAVGAVRPKLSLGIAAILAVSIAPAAIAAVVVFRVHLKNCRARRRNLSLHLASPRQRQGHPE